MILNFIAGLFRRDEMYLVSDFEAQEFIKKGGWEECDRKAEVGFVWIKRLDSPSQSTQHAEPLQ